MSYKKLLTTLLIALCLWQTAPSAAWAQVSTDGSAMESWQEVPQFIKDELKDLVDPLKKRISRLAESVTSAIMGADQNETRRSISEMKAAAANTDHAVNMDITLETNKALLAAKREMQPTIADCAMVTRANQRSEGAVVTTLLTNSLANENSIATAGAASSTKKLIENLNGRYQGAYLFEESLKRMPVGAFGLKDPVTFVDPQTGAKRTITPGQNIPGGPDNVNASLANPSAYFVDVGTLTSLNSTQASAIAEDKLVLLQHLCGGAAGQQNDEGLVEMVSVRSNYTAGTKAAMKRNFCRNYLDRLYAMRLPTQGKNSGKIAVERILANTPNPADITDSMRQQALLEVGTLGPLSLIKAIDLDVKYYNSAAFLNAPLANPETVGRRLIELQAYNLMLDNMMAKDTQAGVMFEAMSMANLAGSRS
jgi:hypothetical protein